MSYSRGGRSDDRNRKETVKTPQQEWQEFLGELGKRKPQPPKIYSDLLKDSQLVEIDRMSITIFFPDEKISGLAKSQSQKIINLLPSNLNRGKIICGVLGTEPPQELPPASIPQKRITEMIVKSPLQELNFACFGQDKNGKDLSQPVLKRAADAEKKCAKLYERLTEKTRLLAGNPDYLLTIKFPWRMRVGGTRGFRELLLPALHTVYGIPYIPASSLKGIVRAWARKHHHELEADRLLGRLDQGLGTVQILDAFPTAPCLSVDVANPQWHWSKDAVNYKPEPHPLLTMERPELLIGLVLTSRGKNTEDIKIVKLWLKQALEEEGLGSRISAGYGKASLKPSLRYSCEHKFSLWTQGMYGVEPPSGENNYRGKAEFRPTSVRGILRYWFRAVALSLYTPDVCKSFEDELFGVLGKQGKIAINVDFNSTTVNEPYHYTGTICLESTEQECLDLVSSLLTLASHLGGVGRGSRRPLHKLNGRMRGTHWVVDEDCCLEYESLKWRQLLKTVTDCFLAKKQSANRYTVSPGQPGKRRQDVLDQNTQILLLQSTDQIIPEAVNWATQGNKNNVRGTALTFLYSSEQYKGQTKDRQGNVFGNPKVGGALETPSYVWIKSIFPRANDPYQVVTIFGADYEDRKVFTDALKSNGAIKVWPFPNL
ncbi:RAMP superfamily CRISPR-associated protein [Candidatus Cyanaurora vandensis]|uniref:RAMP superfamily CRISPR-associated protein n=1 Tax=Candidatus Cyanaurora vandensis TaxID=2714958 RepID=UPI00257FBB4C|nr:RAMP superfamily CRISPR-associated protein [Candidatus Cyanaurora vandensis]